MNIHPKIRSIIKMFYKNPTFKMEENGKESAWHKQQSGIRQGCPLSPYLFLIIMTVIFHDVYNSEGIKEKMDDDKVLGAIFNEVIYADDTIIYSRNPEALEKLLQEIQKEGNKYGMKLNEENVKQ